jgi:hypothetical protein
MNLDGEFGALVDKCGGDVPQFLNQVFGYLARKTDFFDARPRDQSKQVLLEEHERIFNRVCFIKRT